MPVITIFYYLITAFVVVMLGWNFWHEKKSVNDMILYLLVIVPLLLRILRVK
jgi:Ca2+/H+ antiporter